jgi:hypothetical protein
MSSSSSINCSHALGPFGALHVVQLDPEHFNPLRSACQESSCDASHILGEERGMLPLMHDIRKLIQQKNHHENVILTKLPDGYIAHTPSNVILSLIRDENLCNPLNGAAGSSEPGKKHHVISYSIAAPPNQILDSHFKLVKDHDGILPPNCISNYTPLDHALAKLAAAIPLNENPRAIYASPNLGTLHGYHLKGENTSVLKNVFFNLLNKTNGSNMYDVQLKLPSNACSLLGLNDPEGNVCIAPMQNGFMGYRNRNSDKRQTLIFLANSNDFHNSTPLGPDNSVIQIFKMNYATKEKNGKRIFVNTKGNDGVPSNCSYNTPAIHPNMSIQESLNCIEYAMRKAYMDHKNIGDYPQYCEVMKLIRGLDM